MLSRLSGRRGQILVRNLPLRNGSVLTQVAGMGPKVSDAPEMRQDVPPPGGFAPVRVRRNMRPKFWKTGTMVFAMAVIMLYGWRKMAQAEVRTQYDQDQFLLTVLVI
jgi:hypothetical protein